MNIEIKKIHDIDELDLIIKNGINLPPLLPPSEEIVSLARFRKKDVHAYVVLDKYKVVGFAVFVKEIKRVGGIKLHCFNLLGSDFFDHNFFFCEAVALSLFLEFIRSDAKNYKVDAVLLENVLLHSESVAGFKLSCRINVFDANKGTGKSSFDPLLVKKSLRRHYNKMKSTFSYRCEHIIGNVSQQSIETLSTLHKQRWAFESVQSAFYEQDRIGLYSLHKSNKVLTTIYDKDQVVAIHFGMILGHTLLWHTPVINIKYLDFSPLEVLLFETIKFCNQNDLTKLNFGLGDESYKIRFANSYQDTYFKLIPISLKGSVCLFVNKMLDTNKIKNNTLLGLRTVKFYAHKLVKHFNEIHYYSYNALEGFISPTSKISSISESDVSLKKSKENINEMTLIVITDFLCFSDLFIKNGFEIKAFHYARFKAKKIFFCLVDTEEVILSYGWGSQDIEFYVSEINKKIHNENRLMLFDFFTPTINRGKGYYQFLLKLICAKYSTFHPVIFAERKNVYSNKGILNAGFIKINYSIAK